MRNLLVFLIFISLTNLSVAQSDPAEKCIGTWFLHKFDALTESADWISVEQMGPNPFGILMYANVGNIKYVLYGQFSFSHLNTIGHRRAFEPFIRQSIAI